MNTENIDRLIFYPNGNIWASNKFGEQLPEIQKTGWLVAYFEHLESIGIDPISIPIIELFINGRNVSVKPIKTDNGWNYQLT